MRQWQHVIATALLTLLAVVEFPIGIARSDAALSSAVQYCRGNPGTAHLNDDKSILCFDGQLTDETVIDLVNALQRFGIFVVRSPGGSAFLAMDIADILEFKRARVAVYDYCISACASYLLLASRQTWVSRDTVVAWHWQRCDTPDLQSKLSVEPRDPCQGYLSARATFYKQRAVGKRVLGNFDFFKAQSPYIQEKVLDALANGANAEQLLWTWHPRYVGNYFTTSVVYENYPSNQWELDRLSILHRLPNIILDP